MIGLYKFYFRIHCPFDSLGILPPAGSEIRCIARPNAVPVWTPPTLCDHANQIGLQNCEMCTAALYLMFESGRIPLEFIPSCPVRTLPDPIRPSLELLSAPFRPDQRP